MVRRDTGKETVHLLINEKRELASTDMEKDEVLKKFFASVFIGIQASHISRVSELQGRDWGSK